MILFVIELLDAEQLFLILFQSFQIILLCIWVSAWSRIYVNFSLIAFFECYIHYHFCIKCIWILPQLHRRVFYNQQNISIFSKYLCYIFTIHNLYFYIKIVYLKITLCLPFLELKLMMDQINFSKSLSKSSCHQCAFYKVIVLIKVFVVLLFLA